MQVKDYRVSEKELLEIFKKYDWRRNIGNEYFSGDRQNMIFVIFIICRHSRF